MSYFITAVLIFMLIFPNGCVGTDSHPKEQQTLEVRVLFKGDQCRADRLNPQAIWIEDPDQFKKTVARLTKHIIGG